MGAALQRKYNAAPILASLRHCTNRAPLRRARRFRSGGALKHSTPNFRVPNEIKCTSFLSFSTPYSTRSKPKICEPDINSLFSSASNRRITPRFFPLSRFRRTFAPFSPLADSGLAPLADSRGCGSRTRRMRDSPGSQSLTGLAHFEFALNTRGGFRKLMQEAPKKKAQNPEQQ